MIDNDKVEPNLFAEVDNPISADAPEISTVEISTVEVEKPVESVEISTPQVPSGIVVIPPNAEQPSFIDPKADLIVGATGSGKTINIGEVSDYILKKHGKLSRLASTDPSGAGPLKGLVKSGQMDFWAVHAWPKPIEAMWKSCMGHWPLRTDDPESPIVPPDAGTYEVYGFQGFEGLTSYGDTILASLKADKASLSQDPSYQWRQGSFETSGGNQSYYGMMQDTLNQWVVLTNLLKFEKVIWTALESKGDDASGSKVYGPMIGGKKATGRAGQWFVNYVHMDVILGATRIDPITKQELTEAKHVLFLKTHIDPLTKIPFPCKVRAPKKYISEVPAYLESGNIVEAYELLDRLYDKQMKESEGKISEVAGLREKLLERAAAAVKAEAVRAEQRAKVAGMLKVAVSVPAMPSMPSMPKASVPSVVPSLPKVGVVASPKPSGTVTAPSTPTIQNVRKKV